MTCTIRFDAMGAFGASDVEPRGDDLRLGVRGARGVRGALGMINRGIGTNSAASLLNENVDPDAIDERELFEEDDPDSFFKMEWGLSS